MCMAKGRRKKASPAPKTRSKPSHSPLFRSAVEVLEHGLWHFFRSDTTVDMKFAIMHVDQAIELLLKERVLRGGKSIYKTPKETISIWKAYEILEKDLACTIPERPKLEMLHEERNSIQHKYANPSPADAVFLIEGAFAFVERFMMEELDAPIDDHLPSAYIDQLRS